MAKLIIDNSKIYVTFMHHLSCLTSNKDCNNDNIHSYIAKCGENMNKSYHESFRTF